MSTKKNINETPSTISFENSYIKVVIEKNGGNVTEIINKMTGDNVLDYNVDLSNSEIKFMTNELKTNHVSNSYFTYLFNDDGEIIAPNKLSLDGNKIEVTYKNGFEAVLTIDVKEFYFSVTLENDLTKDFDGIVLCNLKINSLWELNNPNAFGLSAIPMTTTVNIEHLPGGKDKTAKGETYSYLGVSTAGAKLGVAFSKMTEHRSHLKALTDDIDKKYGIKSTRGGAYTYDNDDISGDYITISHNFNLENAEETSKLCKEYSVDEVHIHQLDVSFTTGDFNFVCASTDEEKKEGKFVDAATFKERMGHYFLEKGIHLDLHTFSTLVHPNAYGILSNPEYQKDIVKAEETWTLKDSIDENTTELLTIEDASNFIYDPLSSVPYSSSHTHYIIIDEEIIKVENGGDEKGFLNVTRGERGTKATSHKKGAKIEQLRGYYGCFQPKVLSPLFYQVARNSAKAYNDGGFDMFYLDGFEAFTRQGLSDKRISYYVYAEFLRELLYYCDNDPFIEMSTIMPCFWAARGRGGAVDFSKRAYKQQMKTHISVQSRYLNCFYTATVGWFNYAADRFEQYKDTYFRTLHRDDLDHMGSLALAYDFGTVCNGFNVVSVNSPTHYSHNFMYYGLYSRLRKGNYFSPEVKQALLDGNEHKVFKQDDGTWAFKEMKYAKHKVYDAKEKRFNTATIVNPYSEQKPFIRIEQNYSAKNNDNGVVIYNFDETKPIASLLGSHDIGQINADNKYALKIKVFGNGSESDAVLISVKSRITPNRESYEYIVPVNFNGWREIVLVEANNEEFEKYSFKNMTKPTNAQHITYRGKVDFSKLTSVQVTYSGDCDGVRLGALTAFTPADTPVVNPKIKINGKTMTFLTELHSSEFIEYYPEESKAYLSYYDKSYDETGKWSGDVAHVKEINFTGEVLAPNGSFSFTYNGDSEADAPTRAQIVFGFSGKIIENPKTWTVPEIDMPKDIEKIALY